MRMMRMRMLCEDGVRAAAGFTSGFDHLHSSYVKVVKTHRVKWWEGSVCAMQLIWPATRMWKLKSYLLINAPPDLYWHYFGTFIEFQYFLVWHCQITSCWVLYILMRVWNVAYATFYDLCTFSTWGPLWVYFCDTLVLLTYVPLQVFPYYTFSLFATKIYCLSVNCFCLFLSVAWTTYFCFHLLCLVLFLFQ